MSSLKRLAEVEKQLPVLLQDREGWNSLMIAYYPPVVERVWRTLDTGERLSIHRIHPCRKGESLYHPHNWPGAFRVYGEYEMGVGFSETLEAPRRTLMLMHTASGFAYEMTDRDSWHWVRPLDRPVLTVMVTGKPWDRPMPEEPQEPLEELTPGQKEHLLRDFEVLLGLR